MRFDVITLFPEMFDALTAGGVTGRAIDRGQVSVKFWNPRDYATDRHRTVDDRPYGGGPGMVMKFEPLAAAIRAAITDDLEPAHAVYLSPQGARLDQTGVRRLSGFRRIVLIAGRYEAIDERVIEEFVDEEVSIGDYVLSGGELAAMVVIDASSRLLPGVLGDEDSAQQDSFGDGVLDCPHYTRPEVVDGKSVPNVLLSGDHKAIARWRLKESLGRTWLRRPELLEGRRLTDEEAYLLNEFRREQD